MFCKKIINTLQAVSLSIYCTHTNAPPPSFHECTACSLRPSTYIFHSVLSNRWSQLTVNRPRCSRRVYTFLFCRSISPLCLLLLSLCRSLQPQNSHIVCFHFFTIIVSCLLSSGSVWLLLGFQCHRSSGGSAVQEERQDGVAERAELGGMLQIRG